MFSQQKQLTRILKEFFLDGVKFFEAMDPNDIRQGLNILSGE
jgi:hypothetical protein